MQKDVKIGLAIGGLLIVLVAIFWWARMGSKEDAPINDTIEEVEMGRSDEPDIPVDGGPAISNWEEALPTAPPSAVPIVTTPTTLPVAPLIVRMHTVVSGDTLSKIAQKYYGSSAPQKVDLICQANRDKIPNPDFLKVGTVLVIPDASATGAAGVLSPPPSGNLGGSGQTYTVAEEDTLSDISLKYYGTKNKWELIWKANVVAIPDPNKLKVGTVIIIPPAPRTP